MVLVEIYIDIPKILMNNRNFKEQFQTYLGLDS